MIELDTRKQFVFKGGVTIQIVDDNLEISGFTKLVFVWEESQPGIYHTEEYEEGKVTFLPDPYVNWTS